ncbi:MAG TPA: sigma-70 family RNA polymerase sigma factor [Agriterribacter sp.]|nr:sigma-70 family RNA polymerase sigma factor [Agriterribacter sp.]
MESLILQKIYDVSYASTQPFLLLCMSIQQNIHQLPDTLQVIIKGCLSGSRASQSRLYQMFAPKMMGVCMWYTRNREEAEEVLQDGFMRVFTYLHTYSGEGSFEGWIRKIMVNAALLKYRNKSSRLWVVTGFDAELHDLAEEATFINNYDKAELVKLVQTLPPAYRMVFNLFVLEGFKHREIATALNISEGTSKSNLADARKILQSALLATKKVASP